MKCDAAKMQVRGSRVRVRGSRVRVREKDKEKHD